MSTTLDNKFWGEVKWTIGMIGITFQPSEHQNRNSGQGSWVNYTLANSRKLLSAPKQLFERQSSVGVRLVGRWAGLTN